MSQITYLHKQRYGTGNKPVPAFVSSFLIPHISASIFSCLSWIFVCVTSVT